MFLMSHKPVKRTSQDNSLAVQGLIPDGKVGFRDLLFWVLRVDVDGCARHLFFIYEHSIFGDSKIPNKQWYRFDRLYQLQLVTTPLISVDGSQFEKIWTKQIN